MRSVTRRTSTGRARRGSVEGHVFDAVERLLAAGEPYTSLGVQRIADEAGVARSSFYLHFADKTDLLMRVVSSATDDLFEVATQWLGGDGPQDREGLSAATREVVAQHRMHGPLLMALEEVAAYDEAVAAFWRDLMGRFVTVIGDRLERERAAGRLAEGVDIPTTAHWLAWGIERAAGREIGGAPCAEADDALARTLARAIWGTLYGPA